MSTMAYPTPEHEAAAETAVSFLQTLPNVQAILLVNSIARGKASISSDVDVEVLIDEQADDTPLMAAWQAHYARHPAFRQLQKHGQFAVTHVDFFNGRFSPAEPNESGPPDGFELGLGNLLYYAVPLWQTGKRLQQLHAQWLPFYQDDLRARRLTQIGRYFHSNLDHIPYFVERQLYFQALDRLYNAAQQFLQLLFIKRRLYPIAYNKWIKEQLFERLNLPHLYTAYLNLFAIPNLAGRVLNKKAVELTQLAEEYIDA